MQSIPSELPTKKSELETAALELAQNLYEYHAPANKAYGSPTPPTRAMIWYGAGEPGSAPLGPITWDPNNFYNVR